MKLAVVGGGSTYTPELIDGIARLAGEVKVTELVLVDPDASRLAVVGPFSARIMRALRPPGHAALDGQPGRRAWTAPARCCSSCGSAARRPASGTRPGRMECGCIGQETTGRRRARQGAAHRPGRSGYR